MIVLKAAQANLLEALQSVAGIVEDFVRPGSYAGRQLRRWSGQWAIVGDVSLQPLVDEIVERLGGKWANGAGMCRCPTHDDRSPSLSVRVGDRSLFFHCFSGCDTLDVLHALRRGGTIGREGILSTEDVGQRDVLGLAVDLTGDQAHGDTCDRRAQWHTGVEQRHGRSADRAHRGRAIGAESLGHLANRVRELLAAGQHRHEGALGQEAVNVAKTAFRSST